MGREIRRVPLDWEHPRYTAEHAGRYKVGSLMPTFDKDYETAGLEWLAQNELWSKGEHPDQKKSSVKNKYRFYWDWSNSPPDQDSYRARKWTAEEAAGWVVYETITEGTPVTPVFATPEELIEHLVSTGTVWDNGQGWPRENAEEFVKIGYAFTMMMQPGQAPKAVNEPGFFDK